MNKAVFAVVLAFCAGGASAQSAGGAGTGTQILAPDDDRDICVEDLDAETSSGAELLDCLLELQEEIVALRSAFLKMQSTPRAEDGPADEMPRGMVVAFDRDDLTADMCPEGWEPFLSGRGRMIVGAGDPSKAPGKMAFDEAGNPLRTYVRGQHGGEEEVTLRIPEMPRHDHGGVYGGNGDKAGMNNDFAYHAAGYQQVIEEGEGAPHNNMPPFIALYYCKKLGR